MSVEEAEALVSRLLPEHRVLKVFAAEAGQTRFTIRAPIYLVTGNVLQAEPADRVDADERRVIDLERLELEQNEYDVVLCVDVLEHVREPLKLFPVFSRALKPNGLLVLVLPNVASLKAFIVRLAPWRFRLWFYTRFFQYELFPVQTVHSRTLRLPSLLAQARSGGWKTEHVCLYEGPTQRALRHRLKLVGWRWSVVATLTRLMTFGALTAEETGIILVLSKGAG